MKTSISTCTEGEKDQSKIINLPKGEEGPMKTSKCLAKKESHLWQLVLKLTGSNQGVEANRGGYIREIPPGHQRLALPLFVKMEGQATHEEEVENMIKSKICFYLNFKRDVDYYRAVTMVQEFKIIFEHENGWIFADFAWPGHYPSLKTIKVQIPPHDTKGSKIYNGLRDRQKILIYVGEGPKTSQPLYFLKQVQDTLRACKVYLSYLMAFIADIFSTIKPTIDKICSSSNDDKFELEAYKELLDCPYAPYSDINEI